MNKEEFINGFEKRFWETIERFKLIRKNEKIGVAISGGKDSSTILYLLSKRYRVKAIGIDEGTSYRRKTLSNAKRLAKQTNSEYIEYSFKEYYGYSLPEIIEIYRKNNDNTKPCTICGILRRALLNDIAKKEVDVLAMGHNLDDEAQSILMSIFKGNPEFLQRLGPRSNKIEGFIPRIKPLYLHTEKEILSYALIMKLVDKSITISCPFSGEAYRNTARQALRVVNKKELVEGFLKLKKHIVNQPRTINKCKICGSPTSGEICSRCKVLQKIEKYVNNMA